MTHTYSCFYCKSRNVTPMPDQLHPICSACNGTLDKIALCESCGADADEVDGEVCLECLCDQVRSGETSIDCMTEQLSKRVLNHMRKTVEPRVPNLRVRQAGAV